MDEQIDLHIANLLGLVEFLQSLKRKAPAPPEEIDRLFRKLLFHQKWPAAVGESNLCNPQSDDQKLRRARVVLDQLVDRDLRDCVVLDYGCGDGFVTFASLEQNPIVSVGYDPVSHAWGVFPPKGNLEFTDSLQSVRSGSPYDVILAHDVLDHAEDPVACLREMKSLLPRDFGRVYVRFHPFCARHGSHHYDVINKAYFHLVFSPQEMWTMGCPEIRVSRVLRPLDTYRGWVDEAGFEIRSERVISADVEDFFKATKISRKIRTLYGSEAFPEEHLKIQFVDYCLT